MKINKATGWVMVMLGLVSAPAYAADVVVGFEAAEGYVAGSAPPAPWLSRDGNGATTDQVRVSSAQYYSGSQSLSVLPDSYDRAVYPVMVQSNETASFTVWVRPASHLYNEEMGGVSVHELAPNDYWYATCGVTFNANIFAEPEDGTTMYNLTFADGYTMRHVGDFTKETWYPVACDITTSQIVFTVTVDTGTYTNAFPRTEGYKVTEIRFHGRQFAVDPAYLGLDSQIVYFDDFTFTAPPEPATLTIASAYGYPVPAVGIHDFFVGDVVTCQVASVTDSLTNYSASGWTAAGHNPSDGIGDQVALTLSGDTELTWNWQTNYWLDVSVSGSGSVNQASGWYEKDEVLELVPTPASGWLFMGWSGDAAGDGTALLTMSRPRSVTAVFSDDADGDGLTNDEEAALGSDPWKTDTDGDGFDDAFEVAQGMSPTNDNSAVVSYIANHASTFALYPSNAVLDVALGQLLLETAGGNAALNLQLETSADLVTWTNAGEAVEWTLPVEGNVQFFRVRAE